MGSANCKHRQTRTGRTRPYRTSKYSALGGRSMLTAHEYRCDCGHVGWSAHTGVLQRPVDELE